MHWSERCLAHQHLTSGAGSKLGLLSCESWSAEYDCDNKHVEMFEKILYDQKLRIYAVKHEPIINDKLVHCIRVYQRV